MLYYSALEEHRVVYRHGKGADCLRPAAEPAHIGQETAFPECPQWPPQPGGPPLEAGQALQGFPSTATSGQDSGMPRIQRKRHAPDPQTDGRPPFLAQTDPTQAILPAQLPPREVWHRTPPWTVSYLPVNAKSNKKESS